MNDRVLVSGGGVAGLALACWLVKAGFKVTVVERLPGSGSGGQAVDVRGVALDVVKAMGLYDDIHALRTQLRGMSIVDGNGVEIERTEERTFSAGRLDSDDIEIFRDDLCRLLMDKAGDGVEYINENSIKALVQDDQSVTASFHQQPDRHFDLVIGADGVYSNVRKLVFDDEASVLMPLGVIMALFSTPNLLDLQHWQLAYRDQDFGYVIYPSRDQRELRLGIGFGVDDQPLPRNDEVAQKNRIAAHCAHLGGKFPELIESMRDAQQFYCGELAQVRMPAWSRGRVVLAGDAAHCSSPFSGQGTSLALVGAMALVAELVRSPDDPSRAFAAYEQRMRPYVDLNQALVDLAREGPLPDEQLTTAKNGIVLDDLFGLFDGQSAMVRETDEPVNEISLPR